MIAARGQDFERLRLDRRLFGERLHLLQSGSIDLGNRFEADDARQFLDEIRFDRDVEAVRRRRHQPAGFVGTHTHAQGLQRRLYVVVGDACAEQSRDAIAAQRHFEAFWQAVGILDDMRGSGSPPAISSRRPVARAMARSW